MVIVVCPKCGLTYPVTIHYTGSFYCAHCMETFPMYSPIWSVMEPDPLVLARMSAEEPNDENAET